MSYLVTYHEDVLTSDVAKITTEWKKKIRTAIEEKLTTHPDLYGKPLRRTLKEYRKLRVGDYRVIFRIESRRVKVFVIGHRSNVYELASIRLR